MYGLEKSYIYSSESGQSRQPVQQGHSVNASGRLVASNGLIAPGVVCSLPTLVGVPSLYQSVEGSDTVAAVAKSLLACGLAKKHTWAETKGDAFQFLEHSVQSLLDEYGRADIEREFFLNVGIVSDLDSYGPDSGRFNGELYLVIEPESAGYVVLGPTLRELERIHPHLPVTFFSYFTDALNRWIRVYDYRDAAERVEQLREWYASDPEAESFELPDVEGAMPKGFRGRRRTLGEKTVERLANSVRRRKTHALLAGVLALRALSAKCARPQISEETRERLMDSNPPVPSLVAVFEKRDAIEGCFDEEAQGMLECAPEPNLIVPFRPHDQESVRQAFETLHVVCKVLQSAARLMGLMAADRE